MGKSFHRTLRGASRLAVVAFSAVAIVATWLTIAVASNEDVKQPAGRAAEISGAEMLKAAGDATLLRSALSGDVKATAKLLRASDQQVRTAARKPRSYKLTWVLAAAVDWPYVYSIVSTVPLEKLAVNGSDDGGYAFRLIRRDVLTGKATRLMRLHSWFPSALKAGGGRVLVGLSRASQRNNATSVVAFDSDSTTPQWLVQDHATLPEDRQLTCGRLTTLTGAGAAGEALLVRMTAVCDTEGFVDANLETVAIDKLGDARVLDDRPGIVHAVYGDSQLLDGRLLQTSPLGSAVALTEPGQTRSRPLWNDGVPRTATLAGDGSMVVGPPSPITGGWLFFDLADVDDKSNRMPVFKSGDTDSPVADGRYTNQSLDVKYCGDTLYEFRGKHESNLDWMGLILGVGYDGGPRMRYLKVLVRDTSANTIRQVGLKRHFAPKAIGCDGSTLLLATARGRTMNVSRFGP